MPSHIIKYLVSSDAPDDGTIDEVHASNATEIDIKLRTRVAKHLAALFSPAPEEALAIILAMAEDPGSETTTISFHSSSESYTGAVVDKSQEGALLAVANSLERIQQHRTGVQYTKACHDLSEAIYFVYMDRLTYLIGSLRKVFKEHKESYDDIVTFMFGLTDGTLSEADLKLLQLITCLQGQVCGMDSDGLSKEKKEGIAQTTFRLMEQPQAKERLATLLKSRSFATALALPIRACSRPMRATRSLVKLASSSPAFRRIEIVTATSSVRSIMEQHTSTPSLTTGPSLASSRSEEFKSVPASTPTLRRTSPISPSVAVSTSEDPLERLLSPARQWLEPSERHLTLRELEPSAKRKVLLLLACLLDSQVPTPAFDIYFDFGFVVCTKPKETMTLAGLYKELLTNCGQKVDMFFELWKALSDNTLVQLFDRYGYETFRDEIPVLERFLTAPPGRRPTVWRLIQFLRQEDNTDPSPWLQRDYGFQFCKQREEVERLKSIYRAILQKSRPGELHEACTRGQLVKLGLNKGIVIEPGNKRLMQNTYGHPSLGFEDEETPKAYGRPFFKKTK